jgi:cathepsin A (carboxypeptidase C)
VRKKCDRAEDGDLCYKQMNWIDTWMNTPSVKAALGVNPDLKFSSCNMEVGGFHFSCFPRAVSLTTGR